jgi:hypothetical protein
MVDFIFLALTANFWGKGPTASSALTQVEKAGGKVTLQKCGYVMYKVHPETEVTGMGGFSHPKGQASYQDVRTLERKNE